MARKATEDSKTVRAYVVNSQAPAMALRPWTAKEVAEYLEVGTADVYKAVRMGELHAIRLGRRMIFDPREVIHCDGGEL